MVQDETNRIYIIDLSLQIIIFVLNNIQNLLEIIVAGVIET